MRKTIFIVTFASLTPVAATAAPMEALSADEAVAYADRRNPDIGALRAEVEALRTRVAEDKGASRGEGAVAAAGSAEDLEERLRASVLSVAEARLEHRRVLLAADVRSAFARCSAARALLKLSEGSGIASDSALRLAEERRAQGREPAAAVEHARLGLARARQEQALLEWKLARAASELLVLLGAPVTEAIPIKGSLPERSVPVGDFESLLARALAERADLRAASKEYDAALDAQSLGAKRRSRSKSEAGDSRSLPAILEEDGTAEVRITRAFRAMQSLKSGIAIDVAAAETRVRNANVSVAASANVGLTSVDEQRKALLDAYRDGSMGLSQVLAALRDAWEVRRQEVLALEELATAEADLRRALGAM